MKTRVILIVFCLLSSPLLFTVSAQIAPETLYQKAHRVLTHTPLIFEGVIVEQTFFETHAGLCWTASRIEITRIFKAAGDLQCGEIILVHPGSSGQWVDFGAGEYFLDAPEHTIEYREGNQGIFFCKLNGPDDASPPSNPTVNPIVKSSFEQNDNFLSYEYDPRLASTVSLSTINHYADQFAGMTFDSTDELAEFINVTYGIDTNAFVHCDPRPGPDGGFIEAPEYPVIVNPRDYPLNPNNEGGQTSPEMNKNESQSPDPNLERRKEDTQHSTKSQTEVKKKILDHELRINEVMKNGLAQNVSRANEELTFTLENEQFTGVNPRYLEFDVMVECNSNGTFIHNAPVHLSYNTNAFGSNIVANNKITVTKGATFNDPTYEDPNTLSNDWASDTVVVLLSFDYTAPMNRTQIPTTAAAMLHVKIEIANCYAQTDMFFVNQSTAESVTLFTTTANEPWSGTVYNYDAVHYTGDLDLVLCEPVISTFNTPIHGGIGDILTIDGKHFGSSQGTGEVWLKDANKGGQVYIKNQDVVDYISWNDTQIKLRIASRCATTVNGAEVYPGSGTIGVKTDLGDSAYSTPPLEILYSINNSPFYPPANDKLRLNLIDENGQGSYTFQCDTSISNYPLRKAIVERAIHDWNCRTEVNWKLGNDTTLQFFGPDGVNLIYFDTNMHGSPLAATQHVSTPVCTTSPSGDYISYSKEVDIRIAANLDGTFYYANGGWFYDTTGATVPVDSCDFYGVMLHELGHAHAIRHVNDQNDPMYHTPPLSPTPAFNRIYQPSKWYNLVDAGVDVVTKSENTTYTNCSSTALISAIEADCYIIDKIREVFESGNVKVFPNPTSDFAYVNISKDGFQGMQLYSISGANIYGFKYSAESQEQFSSIYSVDLSEMPNGIYLLRVDSNEGQTTHKIIKH